MHNHERSFQKINPENQSIAAVIGSSIGSPTPEKIAQILQGYRQTNKFLVGALSAENLIAIMGFELNGLDAIIKYISVFEDCRQS